MTCGRSWQARAHRHDMKRVAWVRVELVVGPTNDVDIHGWLMGHVSCVIGHAWTPVELVVGPTNDVDIHGWVMVMGHAWTPPPPQYQSAHSCLCC